jgi:DUF4097 and DUF4098 domain-containing protein YvlB
VRVPPGATLELHTLGGPVRISGGTGGASVSMYNGAIAVRDHRGALDLQTRNGPITVAGGVGRLKLRTTNGTIEVEAERAQLTARTYNGAIRFRGTLAGDRNSLETANGKIVVALPARAQFELDAKAERGTVRSDFRLNRTDVASDDCLRGAVGTSPATSLRLRTTNETVVVGQSD